MKTPDELARWEADLQRREEALRKDIADFEAQQDASMDREIKLQNDLAEAQAAACTANRRAAGAEKRRKNAVGAATRLRRKIAKGSP